MISLFYCSHLIFILVHSCSFMFTFLKTDLSVTSASRWRQEEGWQGGGGEREGRNKRYNAYAGWRHFIPKAHLGWGGTSTPSSLVYLNVTFLYWHLYSLHVPSYMHVVTTEIPSIHRTWSCKYTVSIIYLHPESIMRGNVNLYMWVVQVKFKLYVTWLKFYWNWGL